MTAISGVGAHRHRDGQEATTSLTNGTSTPVEVQEMNAPVFVERMELVPDTAGAGRFRGGMALRKDVRLLADAGLVTNLGDRYVNAPYGLKGGLPGSKAQTILNPGQPGERSLHSKGTYGLRKGDVLSMRTAGAGGFGDPAARDPSSVLRDVRQGLVSQEAARTIYKTAITRDGASVDATATETLRERRCCCGNSVSSGGFQIDHSKADFSMSGRSWPASRSSSRAAPGRMGWRSPPMARHAASCAPDCPSPSSRCSPTRGPSSPSLNASRGATVRDTACGQLAGNEQEWPIESPGLACDERKDERATDRAREPEQICGGGHIADERRR